MLLRNTDSRGKSYEIVIVPSCNSSVHLSPCKLIVFWFSNKVLFFFFVNRIYGFVARKPGSLTDNMCHLFAEYEREQPASAIVSFVTKVLLGSTKKTMPKTP